MTNYDTLNPPQRRAVLATEGPVLILAGAGSGKTRVLTHRAAYLIEEKGVNPYNIMAITFTNKAAGEMRERIDSLVGFGAESIWVSTFHSACVRILRRHIDRLGFDTTFTIYDTDDQKTVMKDICKRLQIDTKLYKEKMFLNAISRAKDELISPAEFALQAGSDYARKKQAQVYQAYQEELRKNNALDFDDLIVKTVELFQNDAQVLDYYQERFRYIMVDEYQDTNTAQFHLIRLLAGKYKNLCVVGDDDQSIYKFRGANIQNILNFEQFYPEAVVIKLEENYRSTGTILAAANAVIKNNRGRKDKTLWTSKEEGERIVLRQVENAYEEAQVVAYSIQSGVRRGEHAYGDCAILYRTNAQSRLLEERLVQENIPYRLVGGVNFYARKEIKDLLAYLKTIENGRDDVAVRRIINVPRRGIGATTISRVLEYAEEKGLSFYDACKEAENIPTLKPAAAAKLRPFVTFIQAKRSKLGLISLETLLEEILEDTGYVQELIAENTPEARERIDNIDELVTKVVAYEESAEMPTLGGFLEEVALVADIDSLAQGNDYVALMTLHSAKGLDFPSGYLTGMADGLFPSYMCITSDDKSELEEERRLCYVGITRAKERLMLTSAHARMLRGETQYNKLSRFVKEIPPALLNGVIREERIVEMPHKETYQKARQSFNRSVYAAPKPQPAATYGKPVYLTSLDYGEGDRVRHKKFGDGTVKEIATGGRDFEVTVEFDKAGVKKMFASFAKLQKL